MADSMIFPIGFDLEAAVKKASSDWDGKYADQLEKAIQKRSLEVKLKLNTKGFDSLEAVKKRLAELKIEPITPETKTAIKELASELRTLAKALEQVQKYSTRAGGTPEAVRNSKIALNEQKAKAQAALAAQRAARAEYNLAAARDKAAQAATRGATATNNANKEFQAQDGYVSRLIKRLAVYASFQAIGTFLTNVREVTAQFELQKVSLGAIIQDQARANQLFSEIKAFALKSPISIMDLTKYTKQVAAYGIETEKLFGTTKMLADISVGLGVSLDRLSLFYGQVFATGYLRASEVRQATEAGIPLVDKLAEKLSQANGELVSAAQVMDMISKRAISFEMVEEVFQDLTSAGGMFYNMQEKQGEALYGMWAKLGDAASVMYDQIGNTGAINEGMKLAIGALTDLMRNWKQTFAQMAIIAGSFGASKLIGALKNVQKGIVDNRIAANTKYIAASNAYRSAIQAEQAARKVATAEEYKAIAAKTQSAEATYNAARAEYLAVRNTTLWSKAWNKLKVAFMGNWVTLLLTALAAVVTHFLMAEDSAARLRDTLDDLGAKSEADTAESVSKFEILADRAVKAAKGSKEQKDALEELKNTYSQIIPYEYLTLENLEKMKGEYGELTTMIEEYNAKLRLTNEQNAITEEYASKKKERRTDLRKELNEGTYYRHNEKRWGQYDEDYEVELKFNPTSTQRFFDALDEASKQTDDATEAIRIALKSVWGEIEVISGTFDQAAHAMILFDRHAFEGQGTLMDYVEALIEESSLLQEVQDRYDKAAEAANKYAVIVDGLKKEIEDKGTEKYTSDESYSAYLENEKAKIKAVYKAITDVIRNESSEMIVAHNEIIAQFNNGTITYAEFLDRLLQLPLSAKGNAAVKAIQEIYTKLAPTDQTVITFDNKFKSLARTMNVSMFKVQKNMMTQGQTLEQHRKVIVSEIDDINKKILSLVATKKLMASQGYDTTGIEKDLENEEKLLNFYHTYLQSIPNFDKDKSKGTKSDTRLQTLQEINQTLEKINKEYNDLQKKEGKTKALEDIKKQFKDTLAYTNKLGKKFGLSFDFPTEFKSLQQYRNEILKVMKTLKGLKGGEKAILEFQTMIDKADSDELQKQIEKQLKDLADRISRTKTAKEFYEKILSQTGDLRIAANVSTAIYGDDGWKLQKQLAEQIRQYFQNENIDVEIPIDVISRNNSINYKRLGEFAEQMKEKLGEEPYKAIKKIAEDGQKDMAKAWEGYFKDIQQAESYASKRIQLAQATADKIAKIRADMAANPELQVTGGKLISGLIDKEMKEAAKLEWDAFKGTPLYVQMFEDLEHASTSTLEMMRQRLEALSRTWGSALDPTQLKEMQSRMNEITGQLRERNPWKSLKDAYAQYKAATKSVTAEGAVENTGVAAKNYYEQVEAYGADSIQAKAAEQELKAREKIAAIVKLITTEQGKQVKGQKAITLAQQKAFDQATIARGNLEISNAELIAAEEDARKRGVDPAADPGVIAAQERVDKAKAEVELTEKVSEILDEQAKRSKTLKESFVAAGQNVGQWLDAGAELARGIADISEAVGADENDVQYWNDIADGISNISGGIQDIVSAATSGNVVGAVTSVITAIPKMFVGFSTLFSASRIKKANKEIERQQELLDQLEYTYGRLEKAAEKVFGADYINNFKQQQKNLQAQARAYQAQAAAERSKGKDSDENKIREYENAYRDTMDAIADMQGQIAAQMLGTDLTSAARDFAKAWLDAYKEFGNTADAMSEKFHEMIENMVVEGALSRVMEKALQPMFDMIDNMGEQDFYSESFWQQVVDKAEQGAKDADYGAQTMMKFLEKAGISMQELGGDFTGISRDIAGASEESINGLAAGINTQNYYISHVPGIAANVAVMRQLMEGGTTPTVSGNYVDTTALWNQHLELQRGIYEHTRRSAEKCEAMAVQCAKIAEDVHKVIVPRGTKGSHQVYVTM